MAHELAHFVLGHEEEGLDWINNRPSEMYSPAWYKMRKRQESEADSYGMQILANAKYDANVASLALRRIFRLDGSGMGGGSTEHGPNRDRVKRLEKQGFDCGYPKQGSVKLNTQALKELKRLNP
jgi:Zn-dependent protease with chaperone function